ncbi:MAG TPA: polysaccharide lyase 6 family protein [Sphingomonas sp.]|nr:polysaccharide lyase 6 family protein [Sphingomonas sp.]
MKGLAIAICVVGAVGAFPAIAADHRVSDAAQFRAAAKTLTPGDRIVLADGEWRDFLIELSGEGRSDAPIAVVAEHPGKVILTGRSGVRLAGRWLVVSGLTFRNGYAPDDVVISFRRDSKHWAEHSRVTNVVIDGFNNPDRRAEDHWVAIYGSDNRVDHSHFEGKANAGAMMIVVRQKGMPLDNRARIDHNYFGPRPPLGSNGGETIRIGTSTESGSDSHSIVEDNYFERCDGEVEIVSVKSGGNVIRRNVFDRSQGSVVLRHGSGNTVEDNIFLGHDVPHTGGVRVINERQIIRNNYFEGTVGTDFLSTIAVMNGVPNSPVNRYMPVRDALLENNSFLGVARVAIGIGADAERSQAPRDVRLVRNLVSGADGGDPITIISDPSGTRLDGNVVAGRDGRTLDLVRHDNGLLYPRDPALAGVGVSADLRPIARSDTGVAWYPKPAHREVVFDSGKTVRAAPHRALAEQVAALGPGDILDLGEAHYQVGEPIVIRQPITLRGSSSGAARIDMATPTLFRIEEGGGVWLDHVTISGAQAPARAGNAVIRSSARPMLTDYRILVTASRFVDMAHAPGFDVIAATPGTLAGRIEIRDSSIADVSGTVLALHAERGAKGWYSAEAIRVANTRFDRVGTIADVFRGGTDESTFGPAFTLDRSTISDSGPLILSGVQMATIEHNDFHASAGIRVTHSVGTPHTAIVSNRFDRTPAPEIRELIYKGPARAHVAGNEGI